MSWKRWLAAVFLFGAGVSAGWLIFCVIMPGQNGVSITQSVRQNHSGYKLINPLLDCEGAEKSFVELLPFKQKTSDFVNKINDADPTVDFMAVYFRDLNNGPWFGINEETDFIPASLLKVPVMMTFFKEAETDPEILKKEYTYHAADKTPSVQQEIPPAKRLEDGKSYSVEDLLYRMIAYSDNLAQYVLMDHVNVDTLKQVFSDFNLPLPNESKSPAQMNVKGYASFIRILFNGSYLGKAYSEKALEFLADSQFKDGLVAGVPSGMIVAHKFGEREFADQDLKQLHDCGIVYYPNHPYLLCVMSRGRDLGNMADKIAQVSKFVYTQVDSQFKAN
jgi:beta-lactamase class A